MRLFFTIGHIFQPADLTDELSSTPTRQIVWNANAAVTFLCYCITLMHLTHQFHHGRMLIYHFTRRALPKQNCIFFGVFFDSS